MPKNRTARKAGHKRKRSRKTHSGPGIKNCAAPNRQRLRTVLRRFERSTALVAACTEELSECLALAMRDAVARERDRLVLRLANSNALDYLQHLRQALHQTDGSALPERFRPFQDAIDILFTVLAADLGLTMVHQPGERLILGDADLDRVRFAQALAATPATPLEVTVTASGWRMEGSLVVKPLVEWSNAGPEQP